MEEVLVMHTLLGTTTTIDTLEKASLTDKTTVRMVRPSHAADEVIIWFLI